MSRYCLSGATKVVPIKDGEAHCFDCKTYHPLDLLYQCYFCTHENPLNRDETRVFYCKEHGHEHFHQKDLIFKESKDRKIQNLHKENKELKEWLEWISLAVTEADDFVQMGKKLEGIVEDKDYLKFLDANGG